MSFTIQGKLSGLDDAMKALSGLNQSVRNKILRKALDKASQPILKAAKERAPRETGLLRKSMGRRVIAYRSTGTVVVVIGPRSKPSFRKEVKIKKVFRQIRGATRMIRNPRSEAMTMVRNPVKYAHLVELGTKNRPAKPFLRPAFQAMRSQATVTAARLIMDGIEKEAARLAARGK